MLDQKLVPTAEKGLKDFFEMQLNMNSLVGYSDYEIFAQTMNYKLYVDLSKTLKDDDYKNSFL